MNGIITLLVFICLFYGGTVARQGAPKATMKNKEERASAKKTTSKRDAAPQKRKENKLPVDKEKEAVASVKEAEEELPTPADSEVMSNETTGVVDDTDLIGPLQDEDTKVAPSVSPTSAAKAMSKWQTWIPWLSLGVVIGIGIYVFWSNANIYDRLRVIQKHLNAQRSDLEWTRTKHQVGVSSAEVENLINGSPTLRRIQEECSAIRGDIEKLHQPAPKVVSATPAEASPGGTFYMTGPTNNYFPSSARSNYRENTVYKFIMQPGGNEARFELHTTGASISEIIKVVESYIKPACDEENLPSSGTRNIVTRKQGIAILENEKWIIKDKAIIRYE